MFGRAKTSGSGVEWSYVFYKSQAGNVPVKDFIDAQDAEVKAKIREDLNRLKARNVSLGPPYVKKLKGREFWELRTTESGDEYRTFYFAKTGRKFVLLHAIQKKSNRTPKGDLDTAEDRMRDYLDRIEPKAGKPEKKSP